MPILTLSWTDALPRELLGGAVTVGNFDGVHRGHQALVHTAVRLGRPTIAVTFDPPPGNLLLPTSIRPPLSTLDDRAAWLHAEGADHVVVLRTDAGLLSLSPEAFVEDVLVGLFRAKAIAEGANFRFGRGRIGNVATLRALGMVHGFTVEEVAPVTINGDVVSSSRVRQELVNGQVAVAKALLGRPYSVRGVVVSGARRGRTIGFPTANLDDVKTLLPKEGVYAVRTAVDGVTYLAAANIGANPTFGESARKIEVHLLDFTGDLYGRSLTVEFLARLRETRPFAGVDDLVSQLRKDIAQTRSTGV